MAEQHENPEESTESVRPATLRIVMYGTSKTRRATLLGQLAEANDATVIGLPSPDGQPALDWLVFNAGSFEGSPIRLEVAAPDPALEHAAVRSLLANADTVLFTAVSAPSERSSGATQLAAAGFTTKEVADHNRRLVIYAEPLAGDVEPSAVELLNGFGVPQDTPLVFATGQDGRGRYAFGLAVREALARLEARDRAGATRRAPSSPDTVIGSIFGPAGVSARPASAPATAPARPQARAIRPATAEPAPPPAATRTPAATRPPATTSSPLPATPDTQQTPPGPAEAPAATSGSGPDDGLTGRFFSSPQAIPPGASAAAMTPSVQDEAVTTRPIPAGPPPVTTGDRSSNGASPPATAVPNTAGPNIAGPGSAPQPEQTVVVRPLGSAKATARPDGEPATAERSDVPPPAAPAQRSSPGPVDPPMWTGSTPDDLPTPPGLGEPEPWQPGTEQMRAGPTTWSEPPPAAPRFAPADPRPSGPAPPSWDSRFDEDYGIDEHESDDEELPRQGALKRLISALRSSPDEDDPEDE